MVLFVRIDKDGNMNEENLDKINNLYKKCNLRKEEGFIKLYTHNHNGKNMELWGRNEGRNNMKSKFVFKFDNTINLYGTCGIILTQKDELQNFTISEYNDITNVNNNTSSVNEKNEIIIQDSKPEKVKDNDNKKDDSDSDSDSDDDNSDGESESLSDSELEPDDYVYSSEED